MRFIKKLDIYIIKGFLLLFAGTFFICLFIFVLQFLWMWMSRLIGKGLTIDLLLKFFWYSSLTLIPMSMPLAVLLASLISFGNLGERFELLSMKSAGIPLIRILTPIIIVATLISGSSFVFQDAVSPYATRELSRLAWSMKQKSPELEIPEGVFYSEIPGYNLFVEHKDPETGMLVEAPDDQIVNNKTATTLKNVLSSVVTESTETTYQTVLYKAADTDGSEVKVTNPKEVVFEGSRDVTLTNVDPLKRYYVYAKGNLTGIYTSASESVNEASDLYGVVVNKQMKYVWEKGDRKTSAKLSDLEVSGAAGGEEDGQEEESSEDDSQAIYAKCLDTMLKYGGVYKSTEDEIRTKSIVRVLSDNLDADVLDLSGCSLDDVLYYVSHGTPVMAMTGEGKAVVIIGYDAKNTILYDPSQERVYKMGMNDSGNTFERAGNRFITYVK